MSNRSTTRPPDAVEREQQRFTHLVLGQPRPKHKISAKRKKTKIANVVQLVDGVEERVLLRERWSHKQGTPETHEHVAAEAKREGALLRLHATGAIDAHQLAAAEQIATAHRAITADVAVRTAKLEPRGSGGGPDAASAERISAVIRDRAYSEWRERVAPHGAMLLSIIVDDIGLTIAARRWRMSNRRTRSILTAALDGWRRS